MYLTYEEYVTLGGTLGDPEYYSYEFEAEALIDRVTFNRLKKEEEIPRAVKFCMLKLIETLVAQNKLMQSPTLSDGESISSTGIASQSNDGVSISYNVVSASELYALNKSKVDETIKTYLQGVTNSLGQSLLFRGVYRGE